MPLRPITTVKAAPAQRASSTKSRPRIDTPNPFAALASLDEDSESVSQNARGAGGADGPGGDALASANGGGRYALSSDFGVIGNASMRGSSLPSSGGQRLGDHAALLRGTTRSTSMPLLKRLPELVASGDDDDKSELAEDSGDLSLEDLARRLPGSNSVMSIFVAGLPSISMSLTQEIHRLNSDLLQHLSAYAQPLRAKLVPDPGPRRCVRYAFVDFQNEDDCNKVIEEGNRTLFRGNHIRIEYARGDRTIVLVSPGNVDLDLLKEMDDTGTFVTEFGHERLRWRNLDEELAERLCRPYGTVERVRLGYAAIGEATVHVTFQDRNEARLAHAAFESLPLKAHLSVQWLNSPQLTAASLQPRRPVNPRGLYAPALGVHFGEPMPYPDATSDAGDYGNANERAGFSDDYVLGRPEDPAFPDGSQDFQPSVEPMVATAAMATDRNVAQAPETPSEVEVEHVQQPRGAGHSGASQQQSTAPNEEACASTAPPQKSKLALKRQKMRVKRRLREQQAREAIARGKDVHQTSETDQPENNAATSESALHQGFRFDSLALRRVASNDGLQDGTNVGEMSALEGQSFDSEAGIPATRSEISFEDQHTVEVQLSNGIRTSCVVRAPAPSNAVAIVRPASTGILSDSTGQDLFMQRNMSDLRSWAASPPCRPRLAATPQPTGLTYAYDEFDAGSDHRNMMSSPPMLELRYQEPSQDETEGSPGSNPILTQSGESIEYWSQRSDHGHDDGNVTIPLIHRRRPGFQVADISLPLAVESSMGTRYYPHPQDSMPNSASADETLASVGHVGATPKTAPSYDSSNEQPPPLSAGSVPTLVPIESHAEKAIVEHGCSVWVGSLPPTVTSDMLYDVFKDFGPVVDIEIRNSLQRPTNKYAFVLFSDRGAAERALRVDGHVVAGAKIMVRKRAMKQIWVAPRPEMPVQPLPPPHSSLPPIPVMHMGAPLPDQLQVPMPYVGTAPPMMSTPSVRRPAYPPGPYPGAALAGDAHQQAMRASLTTDSHMTSSDPDGSQRLGFRTHEVEQSPRPDVVGTDTASPAPTSALSTMSGSQVGARGGKSYPRLGRGRPTKSRQHGDSGDRDFNGRSQHWSPRIERDDSHQSWAPGQSSQVSHLTNGGAVQHRSSPRQLQDSAIITSSQSTSTPPTLYFRSGSAYYPGGFYAQPALPEPVGGRQASGYYHTGYGGYYYTPYMPGPGWVYPVHHAHAGAHAGAHAAHNATYHQARQGGDQRARSMKEDDRVSHDHASRQDTDKLASLPYGDAPPYRPQVGAARPPPAYTASNSYNSTNHHHGGLGRRQQHYKPHRSKPFEGQRRQDPRPVHNAHEGSLPAGMPQGNALNDGHGSMGEHRPVANELQHHPMAPVPTTGHAQQPRSYLHAATAGSAAHQDGRADVTPPHLLGVSGEGITQPQPQPQPQRAGAGPGATRLSAHASYPPLGPSRRHGPGRGPSYRGPATGRHQRAGA